MRFCRMSAVILAFAAIQSNGAVNVTASREYVDRKVTSVSNSIMGEVYTKDETDKKIVELAKAPGNYAAVSNAAMNALSLAGGTLTGDLAVGEEHTAPRKLTVAAANGAAGIKLQGGTSGGIGSSLTIGGSSGNGGTLMVEGGQFSGGTVIVGASTGGGGVIKVQGSDASIKKGDNEVATEAFVDGKMSGVSGTLTTLTSAVNLKADKTALDAHVADTNNPHSVTAAQTGAVPLVKDDNGAKTAVTVGSRIVTVGVSSLANGLMVAASGRYSHAEGYRTTASGSHSHAEGVDTTASGSYSHAEGHATKADGRGSHADGFKSQTGASDDYAFAWNGDELSATEDKPYYTSHGPGTFNVNPVGGAGGFYIGDQTLASVISGAVNSKADKTALDAHVADTNNPHGVTASQVGALPLSGGRLTGDLTIIEGWTFTAHNTGLYGHVHVGGANPRLVVGEDPAVVVTSGGITINESPVATEGYVNTKVSSAVADKVTSSDVATALEPYLKKSGGTVTGNLTLEVGSVGSSPTLEVSGVSSSGIKLNAEYGGKITVGDGSNGGGQIVLEDSSVTGGSEAEVTIGTVKVRATLAAVSGKADEAYSAAEDMVNAVNSLAGTVGTHTRDTNNPHKVTAAQVDALPIIGGTLTGDLAVGEERTASRKLTVAAANGAAGIKLQGGTSGGIGSSLTIGGSSGNGGTLQVDGGQFSGGIVIVGAYDGAMGGTIEVQGTRASIKKDGKEVATEAYVDDKVRNAVLPTDPTFSNAVLAVGLNIDTNSVAVLKEIASTFGGFPIEGTATTVGGLLAALAAAVAWLKKNKADKATPSASAALLADNVVALVDGSAGGETSVSFKPPSGNALRYCELMLTGVASDGAATLVLPAGTYQFADGADSIPKGNSHFCFAEYARGKWLVTRQSTTEKAVEEAGA